MQKYLYTFLLCSLFLISTSGSFAQYAPSHDKGTHFVQTAPELIHQNITDVEEIFGSNANSFGPLGTRGRGNFFSCTTSTVITEHRMYLNPTASTTIWFCVYEGDVQAGVYNQISAVERTAQGPGEGWYSSGPVSINLTAGKFYVIYCQWDATANYYNQQAITPFPIPCSFGSLTGGAGWATGSVPAYGSPPPATQTFTSAAFVDPVAYYQAIVSDVIPVELTSFTASVISGQVNLNWQTASETNNYGFEVERKSANQEFSKVSFVPGYGTTTEAKNYTFVDNSVTAGSYTYRLKQVDFDGSFEYSSEVEVDLTPSVYSLGQNYPNPFNPSTKIDFSLASDSKVTLKIFDVLGQEVMTLVDGNLNSGAHTFDFNASSLNSGLYMYSIEVQGTDGSNFSEVKKMMLTK